MYGLMARSDAAAREEFAEVLQLQRESVVDLLRGADSLIERLGEL